MEVAPDGCALRVEGLQKRYGAQSALGGIDFTVKQGEIFGLIGPDGAGKTTTFQILSGVMAATAGEITILGQSPRAARVHLGYLTQQFSLYLDLSILENMHYSARLRRVPEAVISQRTWSLLQRFSLAPFAGRLASQLSGGMKQKLALCCALIADPQVLLLDEPTTGVDPVSRREFWDLLTTVAAAGVTIVIATPYLDEAERCHRIALMYEGRIQTMGTLAALRSHLGLQRIEVRTPQLAAAEQALKNTDATVIRDVQSFGDRLDVLTPDVAQGQAVVQRLLTDQKIAIQSLTPESPTLENVFVNQLHQQAQEPPYQPFPTYRPTAQRQGVAIAAHQLQKNFGSFEAVKPLDLTIHYGEIFGLLGANGAGKTTTIKMLCGLLPATAGQMQLAGETQHLHSARVRSHLGYMSQKFTLYNDLTIRQNLEFYCGVYGVPRQLRPQKIRWVLEICGLIDQADRLTASLPGGWKQRIALGACVMHEPDILFLDEPTSGVDPLARRQFWRLIRDLARQGTAILVTTHYLEEAENCHQLAFMAAGAVIAQGAPSQIKASQPGQLIEVIVDRPQVALQCLKQQLAPWRVSLFGERLHLVLDSPTDWQPLQRQLVAAQLQIHAYRPLPFSLEDAFIGLVHQHTKVPSLSAPP
jgi:ABC-2 type transport system ATP-binding protein